VLDGIIGLDVFRPNLLAKLLQNLRRSALYFVKKEPAQFVRDRILAELNASESGRSNLNWSWMVMLSALAAVRGISSAGIVARQSGCVITLTRELALTQGQVCCAELFERGSGVSRAPGYLERGTRARSPHLGSAA
jgi:hypothetical protein